MTWESGNFPLSSYALNFPFAHCHYKCPNTLQVSREGKKRTKKKKQKVTGKQKL